MRLVVDATVWIDLHLGGLLAEVFALRWRLVSPDVILEELETLDPQLLRALGVEEVSLAEADYAILQSLIGRYPGPSVRDLTALVVSIRDGLGLLSGDGKLRKAAEDEGVPVHGTLWVLDALVEVAIIRPQRAADSLAEMLRCGTRLPQHDCRRRLSRWRPD